jgi:rhodanese-related sulfurtransferase
MSEMTMEVARRAATTGVQVRADELADWVLHGPAPLILDVRDAAEFAASHVPESESAPLGNAVGLVNRIPDDGLVVLVDEDGRWAREAVRMLFTCGFRHVAWLRGGLQAWRAAGYPLAATLRRAAA